MTFEDRVNAAAAQVEDGKARLADAITAQGVATERDSTFATLADNIAAISGGGGTGAKLIVTDTFTLASDFTSTSATTITDMPTIASALREYITPSTDTSGEWHYILIVFEAVTQFTTTGALVRKIIPTGFRWTSSNGYFYYGNSNSEGAGYKVGQNFSPGQYGLRVSNSTVGFRVNGRCGSSTVPTIYAGTYRVSVFDLDEIAKGSKI